MHRAMSEEIFVRISEGILVEVVKGILIAIPERFRARISQ